MRATVSTSPSSSTGAPAAILIEPLDMASTSPCDLYWNHFQMQSRNILTRTLLILALVALARLRPAPGQPRGAVDFTRYVAVGDGFTAGYQDGALHERSQRLAYPVLVAAAAGTPLALPLVGEPGVPTPNSITGLGLLVQRP